MLPVVTETRLKQRRGSPPRANAHATVSGAKRPNSYVKHRAPVAGLPSPARSDGSVGSVVPNRSVREPSFQGRWGVYGTVPGYHDASSGHNASEFASGLASRRASLWLSVAPNFAQQLRRRGVEDDFRSAADDVDQLATTRSGQPLFDFAQDISGHRYSFQRGAGLEPSMQHVRNVPNKDRRGHSAQHESMPHLLQPSAGPSAGRLSRNQTAIPAGYAVAMPVSIHPSGRPLRRRDRA